MYHIRQSCKSEQKNTSDKTSCAEIGLLSRLNTLEQSGGMMADMEQRQVEWR